MKLDDCLRAWLKFYENCQELASEGLYDETVAILEARKVANANRIAALPGKTNIKKRSVKDRKRIAKAKGTLAVVAAKEGVSPQTVANYRREFDGII